MIHPARYHHLGELLDDACLQYPSELACVEADRDRERERWTYAMLRERAWRVAAWLDTLPSTHRRAAIVMDNQAWWLAAALGSLLAGWTIVPIDRRLTVEEQRRLLLHARPEVLFCGDPLRDALGPSCPHTRCPPALDGRPVADGLADLPAARPGTPAARARTDIACIVYSSGTGGDPKGCLLPHGAYLAQYKALMETFTWRAGDRYLSILPTNHAIDFMCGFIASLCTGSTVIHQRTLRPEYIVSTMRRYRVTQMAVVPLILKALETRVREKIDALAPGRRRFLDGLVAVNALLTQRGPRPEVSRRLLKPVHDAFGGHLRMIYCGGAFTERERAETFHDLGIEVAIGYGLTEACTVITVNDLKPFRGDTVGAAVPGVEVRVADPGPDGVGEVQVRGPTLFAGYLDDPEATAAAFDGGWLRTGDLGWLDGAFHLHLVGRRKNMIVTAGGKNVYPEDIEAAFADVPCEELVVFAEDYVWPRREGLSDERLIAVVRPKPDVSWRQTLHQRNRTLPDFKRVSAVLEWPTAFPRTASMKVKRHELAAALRADASHDALQGVA